MTTQVSNGVNPYLSVIIPAYNEEKTIADTTRKVLNYLKNKDFSFEILIMDDGSKDSSIEIAKKEFANEPSVLIFERRENHGKGYTVREGMLKAKGDVRLFMDMDNSTDISHFDLMKPLFDPVRNTTFQTSGEAIFDKNSGGEVSNGVDEGYDVVIGSRDEKDAKGARQVFSQPWHKRLLGNMANLFIQIMAVWGIWDTQCGFKAFTKEAAEKIFGIAKIDRWAFDVEALAIARMFKYKIGIVPVQWVNNANSRVKISGYIKALLETVKIGSYVRGLKKQLVLKKVAV